MNKIIAVFVFICIFFQAECALQKAFTCTNNAFGALLVNNHNTNRVLVGKNIPALVWDATIATYALNWAQKCNFAHSQGAYGENIAASSIYQFPGDRHTATDVEVQNGIKQAITMWVSEKVNYNYNTNTCASGKVCGHYTQVVWAKSLKVGCGVAQCDNIFSGFSSLFVVCDYDPPGNYIGQKPY